MENKELIQELRSEFCRRCQNAHEEGSESFFDNEDETMYWIDTLITAVREDERETKKRELSRIINEEEDNYLYGGGEDENGCLERGEVNFDRIKQVVKK